MDSKAEQFVFQYYPPYSIMEIGTTITIKGAGNMNPWYLTGFADGESYFITRPIIRESKKDFYVTSSITFRWGIQVRADERELLLQIKDYLDSFGKGVGSIYERKRKNDISPQVTLHYDGIKNCRVIREHFQNFPMVGKKSKDFTAWAEVFDKTAEYMKDSKFTYRYFGKYPYDVLVQRVELAHLTDKLRMVRLNADSNMRDIHPRELLRQAGGQPKLYAEILLEKLLEHGQITIEQYQELDNKYGLKI